MKVKNITVEKFKRFSNLKVVDMPDTAKLVVLVGPNGCGKSSLFEALNCWQNYYGYGMGFNDNFYYTKELNPTNNPYDIVNVSFYEDETPKVNQPKLKKSFYFRTAYRNEPEFTTSSLSRMVDIFQASQKKMIDNDATVKSNYERLISKTLRELYNSNKDEYKVSELREELIGKIRKSMLNLFEDLVLSSIGDPLSNGSFYFTKGKADNFHYKNLSGGEKAAFDIILDIIIKSEYYDDTIFCIDEPETHIHTKLQADLLAEMYNIIPENSQLWIATHSIGMMRKARDLEASNPGTVVFLDFDLHNFDQEVVIRPSGLSKLVWEKFMSVAIDDYSSFLAPEHIVFCEGSTKGRKYKDFDSRCYSKIFGQEFPSVTFYSLGSCTDVEDDQNKVMLAFSKLSPKTTISRVIDKDDRSEDEINELKLRGINVLNRRNIEAYLLDDEILMKLCIKTNNEEKIDEVLNIKNYSMQESVSRGNPYDDVKSASGDIIVNVKKLLDLRGTGNTTDAFLRDLITQYITSETQVYKELKESIFGKK